MFGRQRNGACLLHECGRTRACLERDLARLHQTRDLRVIHVLRYCAILDALYGFIYHEGWHEKPFARRNRNPKTIFDFNFMSQAFTKELHSNSNDEPYGPNTLCVRPVVGLPDEQGTPMISL